MQWPPTEPESTSLAPSAGDPSAGPSTPRGFAAVAWLVIVLAVVIVVVRQRLATAETEAAADDAGVTIMEFQAKALIGANQIKPSKSAYAQVSPLNIGPMPQRLRFVALAGQLAGAEVALTVLDELESLIADPPIGDPPKLTPEQLEVLAILRELYQPGDSPIEDRIAALNDDKTALIADQLGWLGELLLTSGLPDDQPPRGDALAPAGRTTAALVVLVVGGAVLGVGGFCGLVTMIVLGCCRRLRGRVTQGEAHHGIYAETFAVWLIVFLVMLQGVAEYAGSSWANPHLVKPLQIMAVFGSLIALAWPVLRGTAWSQVRRDIGWTLGDTPPLEPLFGVAGYAMAIPVLAIGLVVVVVLMNVLAATAPTPDTFAPSGAPFHPIILEIRSGGIWVKIQILALACVAAPVVEETMFRGVFYRHLRDLSRTMGFLGSVVLSAVVNAFIFAAIHPQGYAAIPALMSLAIAFSLMREWRGTIIPCMLMHGISNGVLMALFMVVMA